MRTYVDASISDKRKMIYEPDMNRGFHGPLRCPLLVLMVEGPWGHPPANSQDIPAIRFLCFLHRSSTIPSSRASIPLAGVKSIAHLHSRPNAALRTHIVTASKPYKTPRGAVPAGPQALCCSRRRRTSFASASFSWSARALPGSALDCGPWPPCGAVARGAKP
jgi:hypothetical protein